MTTIVTRAGKGSPLTNAEVDANFTNLNTAKLEASNNLSDLANAATARSNLGVAIGTNVQAWDADLDAIAALAGTNGFLKKTAANTWSLDTSTYLTGNQTITFTGDATGSGATSVALTLANSGVTAGTYTKVTVDAKGRVTAGASLASADLPTYTGTLTSSQVTTALGYTPYNSTNPSGYVDTAGARAAISATGSLSYNSTTGVISFTDAVTSVFGRTGAVTLTSSDVTTALGYTPYNSTNPSGYITSSGTAAAVSATVTGTGATNLVYANMADNDQARIRVGGDASNAGWLEIATADDGNEPIYVRQYTGVFASVTRTLTLLDGSGNTSVPGSFTASGNVTAYSDERLKSDWLDLPADFVDRLANIKHGIYTRIDSGERQAGASAQDWQRLLPEVVTTALDDAGTLSLAYGNAALVSAIKLAQRVVELTARLRDLEQKMGA